MAKNRIVTIVFVLVLVLIGCYALSPEPDGVKWTGKQKIGVDAEEKSIAIPGQSEMVFEAGATTQKVNIYNPEENECEIRFALSVDGVVLWQSGKCQPGYGYYEIELTEPLEAGTYKAELLHECYKGNVKVNSANIEFELVVK